MAQVRVAWLNELAEGTVVERRHGGRVVALCRVNGEVHAFDAECPHLGGPLGQGNVADGNLICPWHGWEFHCATGEADHNPSVRLRQYRVEVRDGGVYLETT